MSDSPKQGTADAQRSPEPAQGGFDRLVREAKRDLKPNVSEDSWTALEDRVLARVAEERALRVDEVGGFGQSRALRVGAVILAVAASIALVVRSDPGGVVIGVPKPLTAGVFADALLMTEGPGDVRIGGVVASAGQVVRAGDVVDTDGARVVFDRARKVTWLLEGETSDKTRAPSVPLRNVARARVKSVGETLVIGLEDGAIEAQVTPVPSGEAFAVDVATGSNLVRVAVHGTHLRVARSGSHVVVDLTEGVVSIGVPPRTGSTYGTLVTAPSHVEFDLTDLERTLRIDRSSAAVRPAATLVMQNPTSAVRSDATPVSPPNTVATAMAAPAPPGRARRQADLSQEAAVVNVVPASPAMPPRAAINAAVGDCARARKMPANGRVTVTSSLKLKVGAGGQVESARFDPPLLPEIQTCASAAIYKVKIEDSAGTSIAIPIEFSY